MFLALFWCPLCKQLAGFQPSTLPAQGLPTCPYCVERGELAPVTFNAYQGGQVAATVDEYTAPLSELAGAIAGATARDRALSNRVDLELGMPASFPADPRPRRELAPGEIVVWCRPRDPEHNYQEPHYVAIYSTWLEVSRMLARGWDVATSDPDGPQL